MEQKLFYHTLHEILKGYIGNNELINDYITTQGYLTFDNIYTSKYTKDEFKAVKHMEEILPKILSYKFYTFMKLGLINLYREGGSVKFQIIVFARSLLSQIMNQRRVKAISTNTFDPYNQDNFGRKFSKIFVPCIIFGHLTSFAVIGEGRRTIYTKSPTNIISRLVTVNNYQHYEIPANYHTDYGTDVTNFLTQYSCEGINQDLRITRNIIGKTAIMKGFANLLRDTMNPEIIRLAGIQLGIDAFRDNPEIWREKIINYSFYEIFYRLINPGKDSSQENVRDPTLRLSQIYTGSQQAIPYTISDLHMREGVALKFWRSNEFGRLWLSYPTMTYYFGDDFYKIQPALYYRHYNIQSTQSRDLDLQHLLTTEFKHKIQHLIYNLYTVLLESYNNNEEITATFHIEKSSGLGEGSRIDIAISDDIMKKFSDLLGDKQYSLKFIIKKQGDAIVNDYEFRDFIANIVFYLVTFNAFVFIGDKERGYKLFASQRKIYNDNYLIGLYSHNLPNYIKLSHAGDQIFKEWYTKWNEKDGKVVWSFEDCWPIFLLDDARSLIDYFQSRYRVNIIQLV